LSLVWRGRVATSRVCLSLQTPDLAGKRLELLREVVRGLRRLAILANVDYPASLLELGEVQATAHKLGLNVVTGKIRRAEDIAPAFEAIKGGAEALYVVTDALVSTSQRYLKFQLPRAAASSFCVGYPRMALIPPRLRSV